MGRIEIGRRIYSITFRGDGEEWTATVGEQLHGHTIANPRARAKKRQVERPLSDAATVRAIFAGASDFDSYIVVTDAGINPDVLSIFVNPFLAGSGPISV